MFHFPFPQWSVCIRLLLTALPRRSGKMSLTGYQALGNLSHFVYVYWVSDDKYNMSAKSQLRWCHVACHAKIGQLQEKTQLMLTGMSDGVINWNETEEIPFNLDVCVYTTWGNHGGARFSMQWWHNIIVRHKNVTINRSRRAHTVYVIWTETPKRSLTPIKTTPMKQSQQCEKSSEDVLHLHKGMAAAFQHLSNQKMLFCSYAVISTLKFHHPDLQPVLPIALDGFH